MAEKLDYIDISPQETGGKGAQGATRFVFQETEWDIIRRNPANLTKEGILKKINGYKVHSNNSAALAMYETMQKTCKVIAKSVIINKKVPDQEWVDESGKGKRGPLKWYECQVLSYDKKGLPFWVDPIRLLKKEEIEKLES